tara:strand:- start:1267 stop:2184 length:918 start_codon:yes stop_codon:yes gene_type:complete
MATPSIAMIPSAYKAEKLYSVLPTNGNGDLDVVRASSATRVNKDGLIELVGSNVPRLDYSDGSCPSLLLEPQSTNLLPYSEDFSDASWVKTRVINVSNNTTSPNGGLNADKLSETSNLGLHAISVNSTTTIGAVYSFSIFVKKGSNSYIQFLFGTSNVAGDPYVNFDVNTGVLQNNGVDSASIEDFGNGWFKCVATYITATTSFTNFISSIQSVSDGRASSFTGDVANNFYIYGAQLEQQSSATSYIPTTGATVTRLEDVVDLDLTPFSLTSITETFSNGSTNVITTIPITYEVSKGEISSIIAI